MKRDSFVFYTSFSDAISELEPMQQLAVYQAIVQYASTGVMPELSGVPKAIMTLIKPQIDANTRRYENGSLGGRPAKEEKENRRKTETKPNKNQNKTKVKPNENENENVNDFKKEKIQKEKTDGDDDPFPVSDSLPHEVEDDVAPPPGDPPEDFGRFWDAYGKKRGRAETLAYWRRMSCRDRAAALSGVEAYVAANPDPVYRKDPVRYLRRRAWEDENYLKPEYQPKTERNESTAEYLPGIDRYF